MAGDTTTNVTNNATNDGTNHHNDESSPDDSLLKEMEALKKQIDNNVTKATIASTSVVVNAIFKAMMQLLPQVKEMKGSLGEIKNSQSDITEEIQILKEENAQLKKRIMKLEVANSNKALILKKMVPKLGPNDKNENLFNLKSNFDKMLEKMGLKNQVKVDDIFRFKPKNNENGKDARDGVAPVRVSFVSNFDKNLFLANLGKLKKSDYNNVIVGIDVPTVALPAFFELDTFNYNFRKENAKCRTRFGLRNDGLELFGKLNGETKFTKISEIKF